MHKSYKASNNNTTTSQIRRSTTGTTVHITTTPTIICIVLEQYAYYAYHHGTSQYQSTVGVLYELVVLLPYAYSHLLVVVVLLLCIAGSMYAYYTTTRSYSIESQQQINIREFYFYCSSYYSSQSIHTTRVTSFKYAYQLVLQCMRTLNACMHTPSQQ